MVVDGMSSILSGSYFWHFLEGCRCADLCSVFLAEQLFLISRLGAIQLLSRAIITLHETMFANNIPERIIVNFKLRNWLTDTVLFERVLQSNHEEDNCTYLERTISCDNIGGVLLSQTAEELFRVFRRTAQEFSHLGSLRLRRTWPRHGPWTMAIAALRDRALK